MTSAVAGAGACAVLGLLSLSAGHHVVRFAAFRRTLAEHGIWPEALLLPVAGGVVLAEGALSTVGLATLLAGGPVISLRLCLFASALLLFAYSIYLAALMRTKPEAPCGCSMNDHPPTVAGLLRNSIIGTIAMFCALNSDVVTTLSPAQRTVVTVAGLCIAITAWILPDALHEPAIRAEGAEP